MRVALRKCVLEDISVCIDPKCPLKKSDLLPPFVPVTLAWNAHLILLKNLNPTVIQRSKHTDRVNVNVLVAALICKRVATAKYMRVVSRALQPDNNAPILFDKLPPSIKFQAVVGIKALHLLLDGAWLREFPNLVVV